jgi:hypothetical protein
MLKMLIVATSDLRARCYQWRTMPVGEIGLGGVMVIIGARSNDVHEGDGHATAGEWVAHVPRITITEDNALLGVWRTLLDGWEE